MSTAAAITGPADMHCTVGGVAVKMEIGACLMGGSGTPTVDAANADSDGGADGGASGGTSDFGATLDNAEGDDDDCKYHVSWTSTEVKENAGVTFEVTVTRLADGMPATGADVQIEAFLDTTHPTPTIVIPTNELGGGKYRVGPLVFDKPGNWTVRFHLYEMCSDQNQDSPHGHAAFYVQVP
jgi:hypothetical protein